MQTDKEYLEQMKVKIGCKVPTDKDTDPLGVKSCDPMEGDSQCFADDDGSAPESGCCNTWTAVSFGDDDGKVGENPIKMGVFGQNWKHYAKVGATGKFEAGQTFSACVDKGYRAASRLSAPEGDTNNFNDLSDFAGVAGLIGEGEGEYESVEKWIEAWGSSKADQEAFKLKVGCQLADKLAVSAFLAIGSMMALM